MIKNVIKRDGSVEAFDIEKVVSAVKKAFPTGVIPYPDKVIEDAIDKYLPDSENVGVEYIQDCVENCLHDNFPYKVAKAYMLYRAQHEDSRLTREKIAYITKYSHSKGNAASNSNTDANANNSIKNVASIEPEVFKNNIRVIQRSMMKDKLNELYPEVANQYIKDIESKIIYPNDESNSPIQKAYCGAYSTYPLISEGCGGLDGITPSAPNDIQSYSGQVTNAVFALSAQTKGAVALGDYIISLNWMVVQEFGPNWYDKLNVTICNSHAKDWQKKTIKREIRKGMKQFIFGVNQPQGNRGFQSPY